MLWILIKVRMDLNIRGCSTCWYIEHIRKDNSKSYIFGLSNWMNVFDCGGRRLCVEGSYIKSYVLAEILGIFEMPIRHSGGNIR